MTDKDTHTNKLQLLFQWPITKNSKVKRAWLGAMGDRPGSPSRVCMSEDKVRTKCAGKTCVGLWGYSWGPRELSGVGGPGLGEAGRYKWYQSRDDCRSQP
jgi:hypothetical protein